MLRLVEQKLEPKYHCRKCSTELQVVEALLGDTARLKIAYVCPNMSCVRYAMYTGSGNATSNAASNAASVSNAVKV